MPADPKPRAWKYMGAEGEWCRLAFVKPGDPYIATEPMTPDDVELVEPVEVTAEAVAFADFYADQEDSEGDPDWHELLDDRPCSKHHIAMARRITERLASRKEGEQ